MDSMDSPGHRLHCETTPPTATTDRHVEPQCVHQQDSSQHSQMSMSKPVTTTTNNNPAIFMPDTNSNDAVSSIEARSTMTDAIPEVSASSALPWELRFVGTPSQGTNPNFVAKAWSTPRSRAILSSPNMKPAALTQRNETQMDIRTFAAKALSTVPQVPNSLMSSRLVPSKLSKVRSLARCG